MKEKNMKKVAMILSVLFLAALSAFAEGQQENSNSLQFAALLPGPANDGGWNTLMLNSLVAQGEKFGAETAYTERTPASDYEEIFRTYAESGFKVVFGHGFEFGDSAMKVAKEFPETYFIINSSGISQSPNVGSFLINDFEAGFAQGAIAAITSKTGVIGYVGGMEIPPIINQGLGFEAGARYISPDIEIKSILIGNFEDVAKAKEAALAMIAEGADVLVGDADEASHGVFEAAEEKNALVIGCSMDIYEVIPDIKDAVLTSVTEDMISGHGLIVEDIMAGNFTPQNYMVGFSSGAVQLAPFREKENNFSADQLGAIEELIEGLTSGSLDVEMYK